MRYNDDMNFLEVTQLTEIDLANKLETSIKSGLSNAVANQRLISFGPNRIKSNRLATLAILWRQINSSFTYLLLFAAFVAILMGDRIESILIIAFVILNTLIGFYQEFKSNKSLAILHSFIAPNCLVVRGGKIEVKQTSEIVPGDLVEMQAGDMVPADLRLILVDNFTVDESTISGETTAVIKCNQALTLPPRGVYGADNIAFGGTMVISGKARGIVIATGINSAIGEIATLVQASKSKSIFEKNIDSLSRFIVRLVGSTVVIIFIINFLLKNGSTSIGELLLFSIALAVSAVPEALPLVTTFTLSKGALRLAKKHVVVKRLSAIEDLGGIEILCTDKTGTLTEGVMTVDQVLSENGMSPVFIASLAIDESERHANVKSIGPFNDAILESLTIEEKKEREKYLYLSINPFDPVRRYDCAQIEIDDHRKTVCRGAPEAIIKICNQLSYDRKNEINQWMIRQGQAGRRVLAIAFGTKQNLKFAGLISFADPLKKSAVKAIHQAEHLGIKIKILTGDRPEVAGVIARQIGLIKNLDEVICGDVFDKLSKLKKEVIVNSASVFARVTPQQKYEIIQLLMQNHQVGFLGEGINDAPALKLANVGLIVHGGADISRESADIVLLRNDLHVIIDGIQEGRVVFVNTAKYIRATLASNFGNFYAIALASFFLPTLPMLPIQILLLNLLSDFPMMAVSTDHVDPKEVKKPFPTSIRGIAILAAWLGIISTIFDLGFFMLYKNATISILQTNWFVFSVITELAFLFSIRAKDWFWKTAAPSWPLVGLSIIGLISAIAIPFTVFGEKTFHFTAPTYTMILIIFSLTLAYFLSSEVVKKFTKY